MKQSMRMRVCVGLSVFLASSAAIGGAAEAVPETLDAPEKFAGGIRQHSYVAGAPHADGC